MNEFQPDGLDYTTQAPVWRNASGYILRAMSSHNLPNDRYFQRYVLFSPTKTELLRNVTLDQVIDHLSPAKPKDVTQAEGQDASKFVGLLVVNHPLLMNQDQLSRIESKFKDLAHQLNLKLAFVPDGISASIAQVY